MCKPLIVLILIGILLMSQLIATAPTKRKSLRAELNPNYIRAMAAFKKLEQKLPREELRAITTIGILNGAKQVEKEMEKYLVNNVQDLILNTDINNKENVMPKIERIEKQLKRDQRALEILTSAMDLAIKTKNVDEFKTEMQQTLQEVRRQGDAGSDSENGTSKESDKADQQVDNIAERVATLRENILKQVDIMKTMVTQKIEHTLDHLIEQANDDGVVAKASQKVVRKRDANYWREEPAQIRMIKSILTEDDFRHNLIDNNALEKRNDNVELLDDEEFSAASLTEDKVIGNSSSKTVDDAAVERNKDNDIVINIDLTTITPIITQVPKSARQEEEEEPNASPETMPEGDAGGGGGGGGGLVGIISSLSGGEGGSDIGALIGALTGVVTTLFGPGGLDIESLISTGTSLLAGLLAGNKNFGTVLGQYVGTAFDGLSGGGGAINNGQFIGNFLGTVFASLSADPEDDELPPRPFLFAQNVFSSFMEAKNRKASSEEGTDEQRRNHKKGDGGGYGSYGHPGGGGGDKGGSDSGGFIKHIISHVVGSAVSVVLNAALGASGGASHASSSLFAGSSSASHKPAYGVKAW